MTFEIEKTPKRRQAVVIQMVGGCINKIIIIIQGLLFIPLYLYFIGDRLYGLWLASGGMLTWLTFMDMGIGDLLVQRVSNAYGRRNYKEALDYFINGFIIYFFLFLIFILSAFAVSFFLSSWFRLQEGEADILRLCFQLAGIVAGAEFLNNFLRGFVQALQKPLFPFCLMIIFRILGLFLTIFLLYQGYGLIAIPIGMLFMTIPVFFLNTYYVFYLIQKFKIGWDIKKNIIFDYFQLAPALFIGRIGGSVVRNIEPTLIAIISQPEFVPAFVITRRAADMVSQFLSVIVASTRPSFVHLYAEGDMEKSRVNVHKIMTLAFSAGLIGFCVYIACNSSFIHLWVGSDQFLGQGVTLLMGIGLFFMFIQDFIRRFIAGMGDISTPLYLVFVEACIRAGLMCLFFKIFGLIGFPMGMTISCVVFSWIFYKRFEDRLPGAFFKNEGEQSRYLLLSSLFVVAFFMAQKVGVIESWILWGAYAFFVIILFITINVLVNASLRGMFLSFLKMLKNVFYKLVIKKCHEIR